jgi:hypothetical protein
VTGGADPGAAADRLLRGLGFRAALPDELAGVLAKVRAGDPHLALMRRDTALPATLLHADPLISYSGLTPDTPLGLAGVSAGLLRESSAWFLLAPMWTIETTKKTRRLRELALLHRHGNPLHRLIFLCNTPEEAALLQQEGEAAFFYSANANVREDIFRPLTNIPADLDAVYNARLLTWKRHELCVEIPRCGFLFYRDDAIDGAAEAERAIRARHAAAAPGHVFINTLGPDGRTVRLPPASVNWHLNRAAVGLCLSESEGAMFASMEYLLSGLAIVSTPSTGGRHIYFEDDYCLTVAPDPRAVAEAVAALAARKIPRAHIHDQAVRRITADRTRFLGLLNAVLDASGREPAFALPWPFEKPVLMQWLKPAAAIDRARKGQVDALGLGDKYRRLWARSTTGA